MFEYLRGWKRKAGVVTLVFACLSVTLWVRTLTACDILIMKWFSFGSLGGVFVIIVKTFRGVPWYTVAWQNTNATDIDSVLSDDDEWRWRVLGFGFVTSKAADTSVLFFPYWSIVIPLTALSAWLLLSKRRQPTKLELSQEPAA